MKKNKLTILCLLSVVFGLTLSSNALAQDEVINNTEVISLTKAGLNKTIIINKIRSSKTNFDLSTNALIQLKTAGIDDEIVNAMLEAKTGRLSSSGNTGSYAGNTNAAGTNVASDPNNPLSPHDYGIYLYQEKDGKKTMTQLVPTVSAQNRTGGMFTASITPFGLGKIKTKANLPGPAASLQLQEARPVFYFYLDTKSGGLNTASGVPSNPNEFTLVRFNVRSDNREITIAKANAYGAKGGLSDEYVVEMVAENLGNGIFRVTPAGTLKNGEYGFYLINSGNSNANAAIGSKFFDFGVKLIP